jgi:hypothetical protein
MRIMWFSLSAFNSQCLFFIYLSSLLSLQLLYFLYVLMPLLVFLNTSHPQPSFRCSSDQQVINSCHMHDELVAVELFDTARDYTLVSTVTTSLATTQQPLLSNGSANRRISTATIALQKSEAELLYEWPFIALASSPLRFTTRFLFWQLNPCSHSPLCREDGFVSYEYASSSLSSVRIAHVEQVYMVILAAQQQSQSQSNFTTGGLPPISSATADFPCLYHHLCTDRVENTIPLWQRNCCPWSVLVWGAVT